MSDDRRRQLWKKLDQLKHMSKCGETKAKRGASFTAGSDYHKDLLADAARLKKERDERAVNRITTHTTVESDRVIQANRADSDRVIVALGGSVPPSSAVTAEAFPLSSGSRDVASHGGRAAARSAAAPAHATPAVANAAPQAAHAASEAGHVATEAPKPKVPLEVMTATFLRDQNPETGFWGVSQSYGKKMMRSFSKD